MARARNIKPGFFKNEDLAECSPWARLCFAGLWTLADREGRLEDRPKRIKGELFAFDSIEVDPLLDELERFGFLERYKNSDGSFIQVTKFSEHQTPHYSEKPSVIKPPRFQESQPDDDIETPGVLQEDSKKDVSLRGGRNPLNPDSLNPDSLNPDSCAPNAKQVRFDAEAGRFEISPGIESQWSVAYPAVNVGSEVAKAAAWLTANPKNRKSNYARFLVNWLVRAQDKAPAVGGGRMHAVDWWKPAGFDTEWDARNAQCAPSTARFFRDGKRIVEAA